MLVEKPFILDVFVGRQEENEFLRILKKRLKFEKSS